MASLVIVSGIGAEPFSNRRKRYFPHARHPRWDPDEDDEALVDKQSKQSEQEDQAWFLKAQQCGPEEALQKFLAERLQQRND
jgi:hypothetical protein